MSSAAQSTVIASLPHRDALFLAKRAIGGTEKKVFGIGGGMHARKTRVGIKHLELLPTYPTRVKTKGMQKNENQAESKKEQQHENRRDCRRRLPSAIPLP